MFVIIAIATDCDTATALFATVSANDIAIDTALLPLVTLPAFALVSAVAMCYWLCHLLATVAIACPSATDFWQLLILICWLC